MIFRIKAELAGRHVHCAIFVAPRADTTFAKCGDFCVRFDEFPDLQEAMPGVKFELKMMEGA